MSQPSVIDLREAAAASAVTVVGDLHGSLESFVSSLRLCDAYPHLLSDGSSTIVFNGDFVDRGENGVEVVASLVLLQLAYPSQVFLLRGNHEDSFLASAYGFMDEVQAKYPHSHEGLWAAFVRFFAALPLCALTQHAVIMHGGLPSEAFELDDVRAISAARRQATPTTIGATDPVCQLMEALLWSDPTEESGIERSTKRGGAGSLFGADVARRWLQRHGLQKLVRSHEVVERGWRAMECGEGCEVITVFSSAGYPDGNGLNLGAVVVLEEVSWLAADRTE